MRRLLSAVLGTALLTTAPAAGQERPRVANSKIDRALRESLDSGDRSPKRVIVTVRQGHRADIRNALSAHGDVIATESSLVNAVVAVVHSDDVEELANHPGVQSVAEDATVFAGSFKSREKRLGKAFETIARSVNRLDGAVAHVGQSTLRETLGLPAVPLFNTPTGDGIGVAIVDSGITPSVDFNGRLGPFYDFTRNGTATLSVPYDDYGHGTHIAGLIASSGASSRRELMGVAPGARLLGFKVLNEKGEGRTSDVIAAIEFIVANRARLGIRVINLSLGHPIYAPAKDDPLVAAVEAATNAGLIVVTSAGNYGANPDSGRPGYTGITSPGNAPSVLTVGSVDTNNSVTRRDDKVARYSSRGPTWFDGYAKPDVVAPGHHLVSNSTLSMFLYELLESNRRKSGKSDFLELSGTSMAAAVTSGVVAVVLEANQRAGSPPLSPNAVKAVLEYSAIPVGNEDVITQGAGGLNAEGAISLARAINTSARPGEWWLRAPVVPYNVIGLNLYAWSQRVVWGDEVYTGGLLYRNLPSWSVTAQWGDDNIVWGTAAELFDDNIVWGTTETWARNIVWPHRVIGQMFDDNIVWGTWDDNIVWGTNDDNIVWGTLDFDNIVWGTYFDDNIVWGTWSDDNIVWGTFTGDDNIVWGTDFDNIVWGTNYDENIIWGTWDDNIIWGTTVELSGLLGVR
jgi:serine protease AprX